MIDTLILGGDVYDGLGGPPARADLAVTGDRVTAIGDLRHEHAGVTVDAGGCAVTPGFIDIHTHSDFALLLNRAMKSTLAQGVTTEVMGNCGLSIGLIQHDPRFAQELRWAERGGLTVDWTSLGEYFARVEDGGIAANVLSLAGHGSIRKRVMGFSEAAPNDAEMSAMLTLLEGALLDGAVGFSTGLEYVPGRYADIPEQAALARLAAEAGGFYATHMRNEGDNVVESVEEAIEVARRAGAPLQISHHKSEGRKNWGKVVVTLGLMRAARNAGMDLLTDQYPYDAYMTGLPIILLPNWASDGSNADVAARLNDPALRARIESEIAEDHCDWDSLLVGIARKNPQYEGLSIRALGVATGKPPITAALDLIAAEEGMVSGIHRAMCDEDIDMVLREPITMIGSDGVAQEVSGPLADGKTHPRSFGTFPRVLSRYVRERGVLTLSEAIRRMTSLPAQRIGLSDRGRLAAGMIADITVFDPSAVADTATYDDPRHYPAGIRHVLVNGRFALKDGAHTEALTGRVIRRS
jgi:N-acyl-D-amino-acid deacylase